MHHPFLPILVHSENNLFKQDRKSPSYGRVWPSHALVTGSKPRRAAADVFHIQKGPYQWRIQGR